MFEILMALQAQGAIAREDREQMKARLSSMDTRLGIIHSDLAHQSMRLDRIESRLDRVETRLNFGEVTN